MQHEEERKSLKAEGKGKKNYHTAIQNSKRTK